jgi:hypothetical protein
VRNSDTGVRDVHGIAHSVAGKLLYHHNIRKKQNRFLVFTYRYKHIDDNKKDMYRKREMVIGGKWYLQMLFEAAFK